jgi:FG-GAP-like repeat
MKNLIIIIALILILLTLGIKLFYAGSPVNVYTKEDIKKLADVYVRNNLELKNPAIVDVDRDGDFDILIFNDGKVEYYKNTGSLEKPFFVPENMQYDKYNAASLVDIALPYPVFFADKNGDGSPDMFVVKDKIYDSREQKYEYKILYADNFLGLDTGVLITIVLVLLIVVLF